MILLGASACSMVFVIEASSRKNMLIDSVIVNATSRKKKKGPGSRRRLVMTTCRCTELVYVLNTRYASKILTV
jgi:hypothetical protein